MKNFKVHDYKKHWDNKFQSREWGRYPPEDLVRFVANNFKYSDKKTLSTLELGCGPGANLWFLHREGFKVSGIDISSTAINLANKRIKAENANINDSELDLIVGDFSDLPWESDSFDLVIDIFAIYANPLSVINKTIAEVYRVLKPGGVGFSKFWGRETTGYGSGIKLEVGTFDNIPEGPCEGMGVAHFVHEEELRVLFDMFDEITVDKILRTHSAKGHFIEEYSCQFKKKLQLK